MITVIILGVIAYLLGSLSSAVLVCKFFNLPDPRTQGSCNPGATNVLRIGGKTAGFLTLLGDTLKGFIPVFIAHQVGINGFYLGVIAILVFVGHVFPIFLKFQGGRGVATVLGTLCAISPMLAICAFTTWLLVVIVFRYSSLAALIAAVAVPIYALFLGLFSYFLPLLIISSLLIWRHRDNIYRLRTGAESKVHF